MQSEIQISLTAFRVRALGVRFLTDPQDPVSPGDMTIQRSKAEIARMVLEVLPSYTTCQRRNL